MVQETVLQLESPGTIDIGRMKPSEAEMKNQSGDSNRFCRASGGKVSFLLVVGFRTGSTRSLEVPKKKYEDAHQEQR